MYLESCLVVEALGTHTLTQRTHALHTDTHRETETPRETGVMVWLGEKGGGYLVLDMCGCRVP